MFTQKKVRTFLEDMVSFPARIFRASIISLIILSSIIAFLQLFQISFLSQYAELIDIFEIFVLGFFTIEIFLRMYAAPTMKEYFNRTSNWIDLISVVPFYFGISNAVILRFFRILRLMKLSRDSLSSFFDNPTTQIAVGFRFFIISLIILSSGIALTQLLFPNLLTGYTLVIEQFEYVVLAIFSVEFFTRFFAARSFFNFSKSPANWIDALAIFPFYFGISDGAILRMFRALRLLKVFNSVSILKGSSAFNVRNSILRIVSPVILIFVCIKSFVWIMESQWLWIQEWDLKTLFTIIGFSLGVILSQKIWKSYGKYVKVQDSFYTLHGKLSSLQLNLNIMSKWSGDRLIYNWLQGYMEIGHKNMSEWALKSVRKINEDLYNAAAKIGNTEHIPFHRLAAMMWSAFETAIFIQSKRINRTPLTYNLLLQQVVLIYLFLLCVFIPGYIGMISVVFGGYLLYWMFQLTNDFDDVRASSLDEEIDLIEGNLITLDAVKIENYLTELRGLQKNW